MQNTLIKNNINYKLNNYLLAILLFINIVVSRFFVQLSLNYDMNNKIISPILHIIDLGTLLFIFIIIILHIIKTTKLYYNKLSLYFIFFYTYSFILSFSSKDFSNSLYISLKGLLFISIGIYFTYLLKNKTFLQQIKFLKNITLMLFIFGFLASFIVAYRSLGIDVISIGTQGGMYALFGLIYIFIKYNEDKLISFDVIIIFILCIFMNSVSSILVMIIGLILFEYKRKNIKFFFAIFFFFAIMFIFIQNYDLGSIKFANKDLDTISSGTGRFLVYMYSWDIISSMQQGFFGVGLNAEHVLLDNFEELLWSHTSHNSFLATAIGLGIPGIILYIILVKIIIEMYIKRNTFDYVNIILLMCFIFGITNAVFPGKAGILISYSILVYQILHHGIKYENN